MRVIPLEMFSSSNDENIYILAGLIEWFFKLRKSEDQFELVNLKILDYVSILLYENIHSSLRVIIANVFSFLIPP